MSSYIKELNDYLSNLIMEYNNDYLDNFDKFETVDIYKRLNVSLLDGKVILNISNILKKIYTIEKNNSLYANVKFNEFICYTMFIFKDLNTKYTDNIFKGYGFALRSIYIKSNNLQEDLILF